ncbi:MAG: biotin--[acetyl-CoA-carboxylase] ligase [Propionibacteriaceae bacterium]|nr:biotin--[acetyl-CoA-carboxylase] ligase [Propionibacteriaceae bacterium]
MSKSMWREIRWVKETGSTNSDVAGEARAGASEGLVIATMNQMAGRGRMDRAWVAPRNSSLAFSLLLQPRPVFSLWGWLSLLAGLAVHSTLAALADDPDRVSLKWPNDVLIDGRKVCGILSERIELPDGPRAIVGIGVNISIPEPHLPVPTATSLRIAGLSEDPEAVLAGILENFQPLYESWQAAGQVRQAYEGRCASIGTELRIVVDAETEVSGIGQGVDELGRLQVATAAGVQVFAVGDVIHARMP